MSEKIVDLKEAKVEMIIECANAIESYFYSYCDPIFGPVNKTYITEAIKKLEEIQDLLGNIEIDIIEEIELLIEDLKKIKKLTDEKKLGERLARVSEKLEKILRKKDIGTIFKEDGTIEFVNGLDECYIEEDEFFDDDDEIEEQGFFSKIFSKIYDWIDRIVSYKQGFVDYDELENGSLEHDEEPIVKYNAVGDEKFICFNSEALYFHRVSIRKTISNKKS